MKKVIIVLVSMFSMFALNANVDYNSANDLEPNIVLLDGIPVFVELNENGTIVNQYVEVTDYFDSVRSHAEQVEMYSDIFKDDLQQRLDAPIRNIDNSRAFLTRNAVHSLKVLAYQYEKDNIDKIKVAALKASDETDLTETRLESIEELLTDFGVEEDDILMDVRPSTDGSSVILINDIVLGF